MPIEAAAAAEAAEAGKGKALEIDEPMPRALGDKEDEDRSYGRYVQCMHCVSSARHSHSCPPCPTSTPPCAAAAPIFHSSKHGHLSNSMRLASTLTTDSDLEDERHGASVIRRPG